jgi:hypothetical protein
LALESFTLKVIAAAAALAVGKPEMAPVDASVRPPGSAPEVMAQYKGALPPVAVRVAA